MPECANVDGTPAVVPLRNFGGIQGSVENANQSDRNSEQWSIAVCTPGLRCEFEVLTAFGVWDCHSRKSSAKSVQSGIVEPCRFFSSAAFRTTNGIVPSSSKFTLSLSRQNERFVDQCPFASKPFQFLDERGIARQAFPC